MDNTHHGLIQDPTDKRLFLPTKKIKKVQGTDVVITLQSMCRAIASSAPNCVGLAAPQIGSTAKIILVRDVDTGHWYAFVNPRIVAHSAEKKWGDEGCLSHPGIEAHIARWEWIVLVGSDPKSGKEHRLRLEDSDQKIYPSMCRIVQHEIDHLDGILITEKGMDCKHILVTGAGQEVQFAAHRKNLEEGYAPIESAE